MAMKDIFLDLDGVVIKRFKKRPQMADWDILLLIFKLLQRYPARIICMTDRPAGQLPYFAWILHGARFHFGELGAAAFNQSTNRVIINPQFLLFATEIRPEIIKILEERFYLDKISDGPAQEPGGKLVTISMERPLSDPSDFGKNVAETLLKFMMLDQIYLDTEGSAVSVYPKGLDKVTGLLWAEQLYASIGQPIDFKNSIWIADSSRDIPLAHAIVERGGTVGCVGNGSADFKQTVKALGGIIANHEYEGGLYDILCAFL